MHNFTATPPNQAGIFSPPTSAVNFCEIDYGVTEYIAEFINTLSNMAYAYLAVDTLPANARTGDISSWPATNISLLLVGIGSAAFHATLKHTAQMADELSMYAIVTSLNYRVYAHDTFTTRSSRLALASVLALATALVAYSNLTSESGASTALHLTLFIALLTTFWPKTLSLIRGRETGLTSSNAVSRSDGKGEREGEGEGEGEGRGLSNGSIDSKSHDVERRALRHRRLSRFRFGVFSFLAGFVFWLIDGLACERLREIRAIVGLPWAWLLEFHGTWHVLTAVGAGTFVRLVADLTARPVVDVSA